MKIKDLRVGMRFGKLVIASISLEIDNSVSFNCKCDCGNNITLRGADLLSGKKRTCGCYIVNGVVVGNVTHGGSKTKLYHIWNAAKQRCRCKTDVMYSYYGGRGITFCDEWNDFVRFRDWAYENGYIEGKLDLDRIDNNSGYRPDNCRFISHRKNLCNTRRRIAIKTGEGEETISEIALRSGIPYNVVWNRYMRGDRGERLERKRDQKNHKSRRIQD